MCDPSSGSTLCNLFMPTSKSEQRQADKVVLHTGYDDTHMLEHESTTKDRGGRHAFCKLIRCPRPPLVHSMLCGLHRLQALNTKKSLCGSKGHLPHLSVVC